MSTICLRDRPDPLPTMENVLDEVAVKDVIKTLFFWNFDKEPDNDFKYIKGVQIIHGGSGVQAKDLG